MYSLKLLADAWLINTRNVSTLPSIPSRYVRPRPLAICFSKKCFGLDITGVEPSDVVGRLSVLNVVLAGEGSHEYYSPNEEEAGNDGCGSDRSDDHLFDRYTVFVPVGDGGAYFEALVPTLVHRLTPVYKGEWLPLNFDWAPLDSLLADWYGR